ncbi:hypothetical protein [Brevundimonas lenta]|uniref:Uncharacterized protein n=1 Tax=Brevundimonas lenta TaxID=424796 RepID=A0A7W6NNV8_9CAUL|nr:hypothetical protein [Brevundimonas lenta]MBB4081859.1 hypothetical protein [Brevundimonas lenta]
MARGLKSVLLWSAAGLGGLFVLMFLAGVGAGYVSARGTDLGPATVWGLAVFAIVMMAGSLAAGAGWMRSIDEAAQEAHKSAWYWGGTVGMTVGMVFMIMTILPQTADLDIPAWINGRTDPAAYMAAGAFGILFLMLAGYLIAWAWWWWRRR